MTILSLILSQQPANSEGAQPEGQLMMYNTDNLPFVGESLSEDQFKSGLEQLAQVLALGSDAVATVLPVGEWTEVSPDDVAATGLANVVAMSVHSAQAFDTAESLQAYVVDFFANVAAKLPDLQAQYRANLAAQEKAQQEAQAAQAEEARVKVAAVFAKYVPSLNVANESAPVEAELVSE
jgi:hypothetical protein